jgi:hypothetical protein
VSADLRTRIRLRSRPSCGSVARCLACRGRTGSLPSGHDLASPVGLAVVPSPEFLHRGCDKAPGPVRKKQKLQNQMETCAGDTVREAQGASRGVLGVSDPLRGVLGGVSQKPKPPTRRSLRRMLVPSHLANG